MDGPKLALGCLRRLHGAARPHEAPPLGPARLVTDLVSAMRRSGRHRSGGPLRHRSRRELVGAGADLERPDEAGNTARVYLEAAGRADLLER
ncbi:MAG: hypothetical protein OEY14_19020 [Myxococcales bacterium]|nr:hypothetical protein [Myxococcales bacterium]